LLATYARLRLVTQRVVVAAAVLDGSGRLLAARRTAPPALCGLWELPGGKVEEGEAEPDALRRELLEELGVEAIVGEQVEGEWPLSDGFVLHVYVVTVQSGDPQPLAVHDAVVWLDPGRWDDVTWVPADRPAIARLSRQRHA
jgi:8-oxo-dGTP diphosphatase